MEQYKITSFFIEIDTGISIENVPIDIIPQMEETLREKIDKFKPKLIDCIFEKSRFKIHDINLEGITLINEKYLQYLGIINFITDAEDKKPIYFQSTKPGIFARSLIFNTAKVNIISKENMDNACGKSVFELIKNSINKK